MACARSGRVRKRAAPVEHMLARVFREAGARVRFNVFLRDMNVGVAASDARRIEVLAQDLPCFGGSQLAVDVTLRSALGCSGEPQQDAADIDGAILLQARRDKETTYPELVASNRCDSLWWPWKPEAGGAKRPQTSSGSWHLREVGKSLRP